MGASIDRGTPVFFSKPPDAVLPGGGEMPYPLGTQDLHHEVELVVALGADAKIFGYTVGLDLTRRDLQAIAKSKGLPWDIAKGFDRSAPIGELVPAGEAGDITGKRLWLEVNGQLRQQSLLGEMVWGVPDILLELAKLFELRAGDLIFMGTPAGVAAFVPGDAYVAGIDGLVELSGSIRK
jgi:2-keto-4-pentenoate hydratase/2-oxohepta-3-ene-1,7-dioic acid hydratase in catechol pathway